VDVSGQQRRPGRRRSRASVTGGRWWVLGMFVALRGADAVMLLGTPPGDRTLLHVGMFNTGLLTTVLLIGVARRLNWARYVLCGLLILGLIMNLVFITTMIQDKSGDAGGTGLLVIVSVIYLAVIGCLIYIPSIRRLTDRTRD
jgi:hypothetical protein